MTDAQTFTITEDHIKLAKRMYVGWQDCETGAPEIDPKRPYGNSNVEIDVAEILGWDFDDELSADQIATAMKIHHEMQTVLQIGLQCGTFMLGEYERVGYFEWKPKLAAKQHLDTTKPGDGEAAEDFGPILCDECNRPLATTTPSPNEAEATKIGLCEGCDPITPHELHALYSLTGDHPAADEVVGAVRKKLSHTLGDLPEGAVSDEYKDYWVADHFAVNEAEIRADERRRIVDELDGLLYAADPNKAGTIGTQFDNLKIGLGAFIDRLEAATQSIQAEAGGPENG